MSEIKTLTDYINNEQNKALDSSGIVYVGDCGIPIEEVASVISSFSHALIVEDERFYYGFSGSSSFLSVNGKKISLITNHQLQYKGSYCLNSTDRVLFSVENKGSFVKPFRIAVNKEEDIHCRDIIMCELENFLLNGNVLYSNTCYPFSEDRTWPKNSIDDRLFICGFPNLVEYQGEKLTQELKDTIDEESYENKLTEIKLCNVIMFAQKIENKLKEDYISLRLLVDGEIEVFSLSGSPVYYFGRNEKKELFLGFAGIVARGSKDSKVMNFVPPDYIFSFMKSFFG